MMDLRILTLLVVVFGVVYSNTTPQNDEDKFNTLIGMMKKLQGDVTNLENQQQQLKNVVTNSIQGQNEKLSDFSFSVINALDMQNDLLYDFEASMDKQNEKISAFEDNVMNSLDKQNEELSDFKACENYNPLAPSQPPVIKAKDCTELYSNGFTWEGIFVIQPENSDPLAVYCQNGWTLLQKRTDDSVDYKKTMEEYKRGFGSVNGEHWLGLNAMNKLTEQGSYTVRFEFEDFDGDTAWTEYSNFHVAAAPGYTLMFDKDSSYGTAGNALRWNHGKKFSTMDVDRDEFAGTSCSTFYFGGGGWWFDDCGSSSTTGMPYGAFGSFLWPEWKVADDGLKSPFKSAIIKIKRV